MWIQRPLPTAVRRRLYIFLLVVACVCAVLLSPAFWQASLSLLLRCEARRQGLVLEIGSVEGGLFKGLVFQNLHLHSPPVEGNDKPSALPTDLTIKRVQFIFNKEFLSLANLNASKAPNPWFSKITLTQTEGKLFPDFINRASSFSFQERLQNWLLSKLTPKNFYFRNFHSNTLILEGSTDSAIQLDGLHLEIKNEQPGALRVHKLVIFGPNGFQKEFVQLHGTTHWHSPILSLSNLVVSPDITITQATLNGSQLKQKRLVGDLAIQALGGEIRGQLTAFEAPSNKQMELQAAGYFQHVAIDKLAKLLSIEEETKGELRAGQFSFRGNLKQLSQAAGSIRAQADDFQWGKRKCQRLLIAATVVNKQVAIHELELVQSRNRLSLNGEFPLTTSAIQWRSPMSCHVEAHINDLQSFYELLNLAVPLPKLAGQMQIVGDIDGQENGLNGLLDVQGKNLTIDDVLIHQLSFKLQFQNADLEIKDFYANQLTDVLSGQGTIHLDNATHACEAKLQFTKNERAGGVPFQLNGNVSWQNFPPKFHLHCAAPRIDLTHDNQSRSNGSLDLFLDSNHHHYAHPFLHGTIQILPGAEFYHGLAVSLKSKSGGEKDLFKVFYPSENTLSKRILDSCMTDISISTTPQAEIALVSNSKNKGAMALDLDLKSLKKANRVGLFGKVVFYHTKLALEGSSTPSSLEVVDGSTIYLDAGSVDRNKIEDLPSSNIWLSATHPWNHNSPSLFVDWNGPSTDASAQFSGSTEGVSPKSMLTPTTHWHFFWQ